MKNSNQDAENIKKLLAFPLEYIKSVEKLNEHYYKNIKAFEQLQILDLEIWKDLIDKMSNLKKDFNKNVFSDLSEELYQAEIITINSKDIKIKNMFASSFSEAEEKIKKLYKGDIEILTITNTETKEIK